MSESKQKIKSKLRFGSQKAYDGIITRIKCTLNKHWDKFKIIIAIGTLILNILREEIHVACGSIQYKTHAFGLKNKLKTKKAS